MKSLLNKATILALAALCSTAIVPGCSSSGNQKPASQEDPTFGRVGMAVEVAPGVNVSTVHYVVTGNGQNIPGDIPVANPGSTISVQVGLPAGTGYHIQMTATSTDGSVHCLGNADFDVTAGTTTAVAVHLQCDGVHVLGAARVNGDLNSCPTVDTYTVAPLQVATGGNILLTATGSDLNSDPITFHWTATAGTVADPNAANTTYNCSVAGSQTLTITVTDDNGTPTDPADDCSDSASIPVTCVALACGNGVIDPGEQCEPPGTATCDANCRLLCGNNVIDPGEQCEPPNTPSCSATCQRIVGCGNTVIDPGEQCEPPNTATCDATCHNRCGNGTIDTAQGETCDPPNGTTCDATCHTISQCGNGTLQTGEQCDFGNPQPTGVCSSTCQNAACFNCESGNAFDAADRDACLNATGSVGPGGACTAALTGAPKNKVCIAILDCMRSTHCSNNGVNPEFCYCGDGVGIATCTGRAQSAETGTCRDVISCGAESSDPTTVATRARNPAFAAGLAFQLVADDALDCSAPANACF